jgi:hypothetical protein
MPVIGSAVVRRQRTSDPNLTGSGIFPYPFGEHRFYPRDIVNCDDFTECG